MDRAGRRVVVTGMGMVTPVGRDLESTWSALREGRSGVGPITLFDAGTFPTRIAAEVEGLRPGATSARRGPLGGPLPEHAVRPGRRGAGRRRLGPVRGHGRSTGRGSASTSARARGSRTSPGSSTWSTGRPTAAGSTPGASPARGSGCSTRSSEAEQEPGTPAGHLASLFGARGPNATCLTACAASSQAIGEASEMIRRGDADVMLSGGTHSMIHPFGVTGFNLLTALSTRNDEPDPRQPAVRPRPRRLRPRRRGRDARPRGARARQAPGRDDLRRGRRLRLDGRRLPHHRQPRRGPGRHRLHARGARRTPGSTPRTSTTSTPTAPAPRSTTRSRPWRSSGPSATHAYKIPISSTKSMMGHLIAAAGARRGDRLPAGDPRRRRPADDQPRQPGPRLRPRLRPPRRPRPGRRRRALQQLRLRRPEHDADPAAVRGLNPDVIQAGVGLGTPIRPGYRGGSTG